MFFIFLPDQKKDMRSFKLDKSHLFGQLSVASFTAVAPSESRSEVKDLEEFREKMNAMERGLSLELTLLKNDMKSSNMESN